MNQGTVLAESAQGCRFGDRKDIQPIKASATYPQRFSSGTSAGRTLTGTH